MNLEDFLSQIFSCDHTVQIYGIYLWAKPGATSVRRCVNIWRIFTSYVSILIFAVLFYILLFALLLEGIIVIVVYA